MQTIRYRHDYHKAFQAALKQRVKQYFRDSGHDRTGNRLMWLKVSFFLGWMLVGYVILFSAGAFWQLLAGYLISGSGSLLAVITVGHDASHKALSRHPGVNRFWSHSWGLIGLSNYLWELKHHHAHHAFTNVIGYDQDIEQSVLVRLNPKQPRRWFHRYQHLYTPFLYLIFGIFAVTYREFKLFFVRRYGNMESQHSWKLLFSIIVLKAFYFGLNLLLPLLVVPLPAWQIVLCMLIMMSMVGFLHCPGFGHSAHQCIGRL